VLWSWSPYSRFLSHEGVGDVAAFSDDYAALFVVFVAGWTLMTVAMMLPTSLPLLAFFQSLVRTRPDHVSLVALLVTGYLSVWIAFAMVVHAGDQVLDHRRADRAIEHRRGAHLHRAAAEQHVVERVRELGERWLVGDASVAQEHFASSVVRGRLLGLARGWGLGLGPTAVLACLPGEQHDLGLIAFGLALRSQGWRIVYLGPDSPLDTVADVSHQLEPSLVVLNAVSRERVRPVLPQLRSLARGHRLALGGSAAVDETLETSGILSLTGSRPPRPPPRRPSRPPSRTRRAWCCRPPPARGSGRLSAVSSRCPRRARA
jgi:methanogenic corrinoid protein MtbC1